MPSGRTGTHTHTKTQKGSWCILAMCAAQLRESQACASWNVSLAPAQSLMAAPHCEAGRPDFYSNGSSQKPQGDYSGHMPVIAAPHATCQSPIPMQSRPQRRRKREKEFLWLQKWESCKTRTSDWAEQDMQKGWPPGVHLCRTPRNWQEECQAQLQAFSAWMSSHWGQLDMMSQRERQLLFWVGAET